LTEEELKELLTKTKQRKETLAKKSKPPPQEEEINEKVGLADTGTNDKKKRLPGKTDGESENVSRSRGRPRKRAIETADEENDRSKRSRLAKSPATKVASSDKAEANDGDPFLRLSEIMQKFLVSQNIETAKDFMAAK
jgi:hypothetical protein